MTPGLFQPWNANGTGLPRAVFTLNPSAITIEGLINNTDTAYTTLTITNPVTLPVFLDGTNQLVVQNLNASGPGGTTGVVLTGSVVHVPEASSLSLLLLGLAGLLRLRHTR